MIISQGYPLWAVVTASGWPALEPIIAWNYTPDAAQRPIPIGAKSGELDFGDIGSFTTDYAGTMALFEEEQRRIIAATPRPHEHKPMPGKCSICGKQGVVAA